MRGELLAARPDGTHPPTVPPGGAIRFAVQGPDGTVSLTYKIQSAKKSADFYLSGRHARGLEKISFHQSGSWSHSIPTEKQEHVKRDFRSRHISIWREPESFYSGWRRAYFICTPRTDLRTDYQRYVKAGTQLIPDPGAGNWAIVNLFLARDITAQLPLQNYWEVGRLKLADGASIVVVAHTFRPNAPTSQYLARQRNEMIEDIETDQRVRAIFESEQDFFAAVSLELHGTRGQIDLSFTPQPAAVRFICVADNVEQDRSSPES